MNKVTWGVHPGGGVRKPLMEVRREKGPWRILGPRNGGLVPPRPRVGHNKTTGLGGILAQEEQNKVGPKRWLPRVQAGRGDPDGVQTWLLVERVAWVPKSTKRLGTSAVVTQQARGDVCPRGGAQREQRTASELVRPRRQRRHVWTHVAVSGQIGQVRLEDAFTQLTPVTTLTDRVVQAKKDLRVQVHRMRVTRHDPRSQFERRLR